MPTFCNLSLKREQENVLGDEMSIFCQIVCLFNFKFLGPHSRLLLVGSPCYRAHKMTANRRVLQ